MPVEKNALMRYMVLDKCFGSHVHYDIDGLLSEVNKVFMDYYGTSVSKSTIRDDIDFMQSDAGWSIRLQERQDGHRKLLYYEDPNFSIMNMPLSRRDMGLLRQTLNMLGQIKGLPNFRWLEPMVAMLKTNFYVGSARPGTVMIAQNENLKGLEHFGDLFEAITEQRVVDLKYHRFGKKSKMRTIHPYQLKQWNYRWYLVGSEKEGSENAKRMNYVVVPLDRIEEVTIRLEKCKEIEGEDFDFRKHFKDIVGVSLLPEGEVKKVKVRVWYPAVWYLETKPIHETQHEIVEERGKDYKVFEMEVIPNEELVQQLMVYADQAEVMEPEWVRLKIIDRAKAILGKNGIR